MAFDPQKFSAEVSLGFIPSETFPSVAQDALEAGFDGPSIRRMAILERPSGWEVDQLVPKVLRELDLDKPDIEAAALFLAKQRARYLLESGSDPLPSGSFFHRLYVAGDYPEQLSGVVYADVQSYLETEEETREAVRWACENLLDPILAETRKVERLAIWEEEKRRERMEWPFVINSVSGRKMFATRWKERIEYTRPLLIIMAVSSVALGWAFNTWKVAVVLFVTFIPYMMLAAAFGVWRDLRRERQQILWRRGYKP